MATSEQSPELRKVIEVEQQRQAQQRDDRVRQQRAVTLQRIKDYRTVRVFRFCSISSPCNGSDVLSEESAIDENEQQALHVFVHNFEHWHSVHIDSDRLEEIALASSCTESKSQTQIYPGDEIGR